MTPQKRIFDLVLACVLGLLLAPVMAVLAVLVLICDGRPVFYISERMTAPGRAFGLIKLRTMRPAIRTQAAPDTPEDRTATGGHKAGRITWLGHWLRASRLDELPQLWNVARGDISFVGPRPPLRRYVDAFPDLYARVLRSRPGITGLATVLYHNHEERLLAQSRGLAENEAIYLRTCVPRKAALDLIYQRHQSVCFDMAIMARTLRKVLR